MVKEEIKAVVKAGIKDTIEATLVEVTLYVLISLIGQLQYVVFMDMVKALIVCIIANLVISLFVRVQVQHFKEERKTEKLRMIVESSFIVLALSFIFIMTIIYYLFPITFFRIIF